MESKTTIFLLPPEHISLDLFESLTLLSQAVRSHVK